MGNWHLSKNNIQGIIIGLLCFIILQAFTMEVLIIIKNNLNPWYMKGIKAFIYPIFVLATSILFGYSVSKKIQLLVILSYVLILVDMVFLAYQLFRVI